MLLHIRVFQAAEPEMKQSIGVDIGFVQKPQHFEDVTTSNRLQIVPQLTVN